MPGKRRRRGQGHRSSACIGRRYRNQLWSRKPKVTTEEAPAKEISSDEESSMEIQLPSVSFLYKHSLLLVTVYPYSLKLLRVKYLIILSGLENFGPSRMPLKIYIQSLWLKCSVLVVLVINILSVYYFVDLQHRKNVITKLPFERKNLKLLSLKISRLYGV